MHHSNVPRCLISFYLAFALATTIDGMSRSSLCWPILLCKLNLNNFGLRITIIRLYRHRTALCAKLRDVSLASALPDTWAAVWSNFWESEARLPSLPAALGLATHNTCMLLSGIWCLNPLFHPLMPNAFT